ncbi:MAG: flippase [Candidatus Aenigmatarchaeota archaeon]
MTDYAKTAVKGAGFVFLLTAIGTIIGYALRLFLARTLSLEDFGLLYSVMAFISMFAILRELGYNPALAKYIPEFIVKNELWKIKSSVFSVILIQFIAISAVMLPIFFFSDWIAINFFNTISASLLLKAISVSTIFSLFFTAFQTTFQGLQRIKLFSVVDVTRTLIVFVSALIFVYLGFGVFGAAVSYTIAAALVSVFFFLVLLKMPFMKEKLIFSRELTKQLSKFAAPVLLASFAGIIISNIDIISLTVLSGLENVGYYSAAMPTAQLLLVFSGALGAVLLPMISELWAKNEGSTIGNGIGLIILIMSLVIIPLAAILISLSENIIILLFTGTFLASAVMLQLLVIGMFFNSLFIIFNMSLYAIGKPASVTKMILIMAGFGVVAIPSLIILFGPNGAAVGVTAAYFIGFVLALAQLRKNVNINIEWPRIAKVVCGSLLMIAIIFSFKYLTYIENAWHEAIMSAVLGIAFYLVFIIYTKAVSKEDLDKLIQMNISIPKSLDSILRKVLR